MRQPRIDSLSAFLLLYATACGSDSSSNAMLGAYPGTPTSGEQGSSESTGASSGTAPAPSGSSPNATGSGAPPTAAGTSVSYYVPGDTEADSTSPGLATNPFVLTAHDPLSTFAADVDTASYDVFRRDVSAGSLPDPAGVRLEEYVNYFEYRYPAPQADAKVPFGISLAAAPTMVARDTVWLRVGIQGRDALPEGEKPEGVNLVFLVDVSGSMASENKLPLARELLTQALDVLDPQATISIVTYASSTGVRLPPTPISRRSEIERAIDGLQAGGSTAGSAGLDLAYEQASAGFIEGGINHVVLCTDGDFNVGPSSTEELLAQIEQERETGITLTVLGFGSDNLNDSMMEAVSNAGNGVYGVITDLDQATSYVNERLLSTIHFIAKDLKIQVEFNPDHVRAYRLLGYENRALADSQFRQDWVDAGEVGAGHRVTALYELVLVGGALPLSDGAPAPEDGAPYEGDRAVADADLALVKVRYKQVDATAEDAASEVTASLSPDDVGTADGDFDWAVSVAAFSEILKGSPYADPDALPRISEIVMGAKDSSDPDRAEFAALLERATRLLAQ
ncbi:MAG: von Willebrand factor type A domain-containing protein [Polyangiaceae bacterium]|nr:von Willebrand factor type A domain-containing protein [Polyangiaceae bacterium]